MYKKVVIDGYILGVGTVVSGGNVNQREYGEITEKLLSMPTAPDGYTAKLRDDTLEWEIIETPPAPEPEASIEDKAEAYDILMGVSE